MGLYKKACCERKRRVRQKPVSAKQLDLFEDCLGSRFTFVDREDLECVKLGAYNVRS